MPKLRVHQDLLIEEIVPEANGVTVHLRSNAGTAQWVRFAFANGCGQSTIAELSRWHDAATPVTYVRGPDYGALIDDRALLRAALD